MSVLEAPPVAAPFSMPPLPALLRHALPRAIESMFMPVVAFYSGLLLIGLKGGLIAGLLWVYGCAAWRLARRAALPGLVILAVVAITVRTVFSLATDSLVLYFLPPLAGVFWCRCRSGCRSIRRCAASSAATRSCGVACSWSTPR